MSVIDTTTEHVGTTACERPGLRILVVDDNADTALTEATLLALSGHEVEAAQDGPSALEIADRLQPDVVVLDINMPFMNGWEVARLIKSQNGTKKPFIIAVSGYCDEEAIRQSQEAGIDLHVPKPMDPGILMAVIDDWRRCSRSAECSELNKE